MSSVCTSEKNSVERSEIRWVSELSLGLVNLEEKNPGSPSMNLLASYPDAKAAEV